MTEGCDDDSAGFPSEIPSEDLSEGSSENGAGRPLPVRDFPGRIGPQCAAGLAAAFAALGVGSVLGWSSPALPLLRSGGVSEGALTWASGVSNLGGALGLVAAAAAVDTWGRRKTMLAAAPPWVAGWLLMALVRHEASYIAGRVLTGACAGIMLVVGPLYITEAAQKRVRGGLAVSFQLSLALGILFAFVLALTEDYVLITLLLGVPAAIFGCAFVFVPETPFFLLSKGDDVQARRALQWLRGKDSDVEEELESIREEVLVAMKQKGAFRDLLRTRASRMGLCFCLMLMLIQQLSGINAVTFNMETIFAEAGANMNPKVQSIIIGSVEVCAMGAAAWAVEAAGRRPLLISSLAASGICLIVLAVYFFTSSGEGNKSSWGWLPLTSLSFYIVVFSLGSGPLPWGLLGELLPGEVRGPAGCICGAFSWLMAFAITTSYASLVNSISAAGTFMLYGCCCIASAFIVAALVPETKQRSFAEIRNVLEGNDQDRAPWGLQALSPHY